MSDVQVRIRHEDDVKAVPFTTAPLGEIDQLIGQIKYWGGVYYNGASYDNLIGQFVLDSGAVFFEIVIQGEDE